VIKHHDIKADREVEVKFHTFLILALNKMGYKFQSLATLAPLSMKLVSSVDLNMRQKAKSFVLARNWTQATSVVYNLEMLTLLIHASHNCASICTNSAGIAP
jgi:hypothetical protein